jgi:hypothetical protein
MFIVLPHPINMMWKPSLQVQSTAVPNVIITTPIMGQPVQGSVVILGNTGIDGFQSYEIDFSYVDDPTQTWFLMQEGTTPIQNGVLTVWDTTTITDGEYTLRLMVTLTDGNQIEQLVKGVRVRNYSPIETDTPTPPLPSLTLVAGLPVASATPGFTPTQTLTPYPLTPTPLPTNPAEISSSQMLQTLGKGVLITIGLFIILGSYLGIRATLRNRT